jgi:NADPH-dependent 2,4-dienoyl-CoA reductase/sulfur reductase-like enzyme
MTLKERISDIFEKYSVELAVEEKEETKEVAFATAVLESGQEIQTDADAFAVGVSAFVVNDEGERIPLPDGDYQLQDGSMLVVAEGAVVEVNEATTEPEVEAEEEKEEEMKAEEVEASSEVLTREAVEGMIAEAIEATKKEFSSQIEERDAKITELSKQATPSIPRAPKMEAPVSVDLKSLSIQERVAAIHNQFSK